MSAKPYTPEEFDREVYERYDGTNHGDVPRLRATVEALAAARADAAKAREEQREAMALAVMAGHSKSKQRQGIAAIIRATPLTSTPLADTIKALCADLASAREEQRETCALSIQSKPGETRLDVLTRIAFSQGAVRRAPLDATPLGDTIKALREDAKTTANVTKTLTEERDAARRDWREEHDTRIAIEVDLHSAGISVGDGLREAVFALKTELTTEREANALESSSLQAALAAEVERHLATTTQRDRLLAASRDLAHAESVEYDDRTSQSREAFFLQLALAASDMRKVISETHAALATTPEGT